MSQSLAATTLLHTPQSAKTSYDLPVSMRLLSTEIILCNLYMVYLQDSYCQDILKVQIVSFQEPASLVE
jgi:hypothetical protein